MALSEETQRNGENKPAPKGREAHFYSTIYMTQNQSPVTIKTKRIKKERAPYAYGFPTLPIPTREIADIIKVNGALTLM